jgi:hypothetical protein
MNFCIYTNNILLLLDYVHLVGRKLHHNARDDVESVLVLPSESAEQEELVLDSELGMVSVRLLVCCRTL